MDDPWCTRLAVLHLLHLVETGEDMEKSLVTVSLADIGGVTPGNWRAVKRMRPRFRHSCFTFL